MDTVILHNASLIAKFIGAAWGPSGADRTQLGPMLDPWTLLSGIIYVRSWTHQLQRNLQVTNLPRLSHTLFNICYMISVLCYVPKELMWIHEDVMAGKKFYALLAGCEFNINQWIPNTNGWLCRDFIVCCLSAITSFWTNNQAANEIRHLNSSSCIITHCRFLSIIFSRQQKKPHYQ